MLVQKFGQESFLGHWTRRSEEEVKNLPEEEEEEVGIFIPFPGTTKQLQPKPYRGTDPEWQAFIKFSKDKSLGKSVQGNE